MKMMLMESSKSSSRSRVSSSSSSSSMLLSRIAAALLLVSIAVDIDIDIDIIPVHVLVQAQAEFGDYVDPTYNCPATITCPRVCVTAPDECPAISQCSNVTTLCVDGTCAPQGEACPDGLESPCPFDCAKTACPRHVDLQDTCDALFDDYYAAEAACGEAETVAETTYVTFRESAYRFAYAWVTLVTLLTIVWCCYNQRLEPVPGSTKPLHVAAAAGINNLDATIHGTGVVCQHSGYKRHFIGLLLNYITLLTFCGWNALLCWLAIQYYAMDGNQYVSKRKVVIEDEEQLLKTYIITWSMGFVWCLCMLKWPHSVRSVFLRRCALSQASFVAVYLELPQAAADAQNQNLKYRNSCGSVCPGCLKWVKKVLNCIFRLLNGIMSNFIFSDKDCFHQKDAAVFKYCRVQTDRETETRYFIFLFRRYNYDAATDAFAPGVFSVGDRLGDYVAAGTTGLTSDQVLERISIVGPNSIETNTPSFLYTLVKELNKPFYMYQLFMIWSWMPLYYYYMALVWAAVISTSALTVSYFQYKNQVNVYRITQMEGQSTVRRDGDYVQMDHQDLVPGDVVKLEPGMVFCDFVVIEGQATLVDESALTGEAAPQAKAPVDPNEGDQMLDPRIVHRRHTISAGTCILESQHGVAVVMSTGSFTAKGDLLREMFSFRRYQLKFDYEVPIVIAILIIYAIIGFNIVVAFIEQAPVYGWFYGIYVVGTILPPLLPTVFTVSVGISEKRLATQRIATVNAESILIAGKVTRAFFDKTGTLTKQGLDYLSARSASSWATGAISEELGRAMATCHTLTKSQTGMLVGNPVDVTMFSVSGATSFKSKDNVTVITDRSRQKAKIVRTFDFDQFRMTQTVIVQLVDGSHVAIVKGSGESIRKICRAESLPADFDSVLRASARAGIYQISVASKPIKFDNASKPLTRDEVEINLNFIGLLNFQNVMREDTPEVIRQLAEGEIQSIMVTGDSVHTAIQIAQESGIMMPGKAVVIGAVNSAGTVVWSDAASGATANVPSTAQLANRSTQLALSGAAYEALCSQDAAEAARILPHASVFGRCTPREKVFVVDSFVSLGFITLMCGDGGNDCGALKAAHIGVALSDAEASIVAAFTALDKNIYAVLDVLKEGRCALFSALSTYKFIIMYGQIETINQMINAYFQITFTEWCWVFMDGIWTISLGFALPLARPAARLSETRPTASVLGPWTMSSALGVLALNFMFTVVALATLWSQDWFQCRKWDDNDVSDVTVIGDNYESEVLFLVTGFQYIASAFVFNFGYEFRQVWYRNYTFLFLVAIYTFVQFYITMVPGELSCIWRVNCVNENVVNSVTSHEPFPIQNPYATTVMPQEFRGKLLIIMSMNLFAIWAYDYCVVNGVRQNLAAKKRVTRPTNIVSKDDKEIPEQSTTRTMRTAVASSSLSAEAQEGGAGDEYNNS